jgi:peptidoglycan/xylan/chitin deacetylase (PgdA/CDA1 family)
VRALPRVAAFIALLAVAAAVVTVVTGGSSHDGGATGGHDLPAATPSGHRSRSAAAVPAGWVTGRAARTMPVPILMYHVIADAPAGTPYPQLWVGPALFRAQMLALHRAGYRAITLGQAFAGWEHGRPLPPRPVVLSFDDGYAGDATRAAPFLHRLGWPAVLNLELRNVQPGDLTVAQVRTLIADGWEVDSHTVDHPDLTTVGPSQLRFELVASRRELRRRFGVPADFFCYPAGRFNTTVVAAVRAAGYAGATTELPGSAKPGGDPYELPRVRVDAGESPSTLLAVLARER